jgi:mannose-1-phosphate guanylyltransferase/phosphomannomutase
MKAIILCAGFGTRLGDLTREIPKPMLLLNGRPLLSYILANCKAHGFTEIAINLHFKPEIIKEYFGDGSRFGLFIHYFFEEKLLGTAGSVKKMAEFIGNDSNFLVHYGDILTDQNFTSLYSSHLSNKDALATLLVHSRVNSNSIVLMNSEKKITGFIERPSEEERQRYNSTWVNSGIAVFNKAIIDQIPYDAVDLPKHVYCNLVDSQKLFAFPLDGYRCAIDSPDRYHTANEAIPKGICHCPSF